MPASVIGCSGPSATPPSGSRRAYTLTTARNRCHATPIVGCSPTTTNHDIDTTIFTVATTTTAVSSVVVATPLHDAPNHAVSGKCHASAGAQRVLQRRAARSRTARPTSTVRLDEERLRLVRPEEPRPPRVLAAGPQPEPQHDQRDDADAATAHAIASIAHSSGGKCPISGSVNVGSTTCPYPVTQREEQQRERDHHDPVRDLDHRPVLEPPVPEHLPRQRRQRAARRASTAPARPPDPHGPHDRAPRRARRSPTPTTVATTTITEAHHLQRIHARHASGAGPRRVDAPSAHSPRCASVTRPTPATRGAPWDGGVGNRLVES